MAGSDVTLALNIIGGGTAIVQGAAGNVQFVTPIATKEVVGSRLIIGGGNNVWESTNLGLNITELLGPANAAVGVNRTAISYGSMMESVANPHVFYLGSGNQVFVRTAAGGDPAARPTISVFSSVSKPVRSLIPSTRIKRHPRS